MSAARILTPGPSRLGALQTTSLRHAPRLHTTAARWRREARMTGPRSSLGVPAGSSSSRTSTSSASRSSTDTSASTPAAKAKTSPSSSRTPPKSGTGIPRHQRAKVEVIPFRISTAAAKKYLTTLATIEVMPRLMSRWSIIKHQLLSFIGIKSMSDPEGEIVRLERMTALYLPTWIVDASFEIKCRGNDGRAEANFVTMSSRFPGHSWKPMDSIPMVPPAPYDMVPTHELQKDPNYAADTPREDWDNLAMVDYESYESYLQRKGESEVKVKGGMPDPLPFTISPLCLPDMLRHQLELKDATFTPDLAAGVELPGGNVHGLGLTMAVVDEEGQQVKAPPVRFEPDTLKLDMFCAYPILMPLYLSEFSYVDRDVGDKHRITIVLGAWDTKGLQFCWKEKDERWHWSFAKPEPLKVALMDMFPRTPIKTSLNAMFEQEREKERAERRRQFEQHKPDGESLKTRKDIEAEWDRINADRLNDFQLNLKSRMLEKVRSELPIKVAVEARSLEMLQRADWILWERDEREAFEMRTSPTPPQVRSMTADEKERYDRSVSQARKAPTEPRPFQWLRNKHDRAAELNHPDRKAGLGRYIYWSSPHVQRLSHSVYANRRYLSEALPAVLQSRKQMASIQESGYDVDRSLTRVDGTKVKGEEAYKTIVAEDLSVRQQREALRPRWLKALLEAAGRK
ncbi:conserved hypothetical protein [Sporisorium reilianum SRZ2]|uniref:Uncharacterized protein n=1 Tax=Sporisorium reilianum (strain SRZ2) TaxID=999809 RepID=E6ZUY8_SPORE|nr:conserved hypothetical protein [Sporisorium reilianum SRZ2]